MSKLHIKKGDTVYVNAGEDKGKTGRVLKVLVKKNRAIVEGINMVSKSTKPSAKNPQGGIVKQEASIHLSNLNPVRPIRWSRIFANAVSAACAVSCRRITVPATAAGPNSAMPQFIRLLRR